MANPSKSKSLLADESNKPLLSTQQALIADAKVDYADDGSADDLDTDAKRVAAMNATNGKINSILDILEAHGLMADS
jgi:hypothetical protein